MELTSQKESYSRDFPSTYFFVNLLRRKFDEEENLKLVYYSNDANNTQITKTIPIDYHWFKETTNDKAVRCYEYKPEVSQKLISIVCPEPKANGE